MKIVKFDDNENWMAERRGKITGSRLKDIVVKRGNKKKIGFYRLIAERVAIPRDDENRMERGHRLEEEAIERFEKETGKKVNKDLVMWQREENNNIAISPDGYIEVTPDIIEEAVEVKCLDSAKHLEALLTGEVPSDYDEQKIQYFIVNDHLKTLYFVFYDPSIPKKDYFVIEITRADVQPLVEKYLDYQRDVLNEVQEIVNELTF